MRVLALLFVLTFTVACGSDGGGSVVSVFPEHAFVGRTTTVVVIGDATDWSSNVTVDFGEGVVVNAVTAISPTALQVELDVAPSVPLGFADVSVSGSDTGSGLLELLSPVSVEVATLEQGGFGSIVVTNLDRLHPFDTTTDENGNFINLDVATSTDSVTLEVVEATPDTIVLGARIDVGATETGEITLSASDGTTPNTTLIAAQTVTPRSPVVLTANATMDLTVADNGSLYEITATEVALLSLRFDSANAMAPNLDILPASGKWTEELALHEPKSGFGRFVLGNRVAAANDKFYIVVSDRRGSGVSGTISARVVPLSGVTPVVDTGDNNTAATAQPGSGSVVQFDGVLSDANDIDCTSVTMTAINQRIRVFTTDDDGQTDTSVRVFAANNVLELEPAQTTDDRTLGEEVLTQPLGAIASHSVCVSAPAGTMPSNAPYKMIVVLE